MAASRTPEQALVAEDLADTLTAGGYPCSDWEPIAGTNGSIDMGSCRDGGVVISLYALVSDAEGAPDYLFAVMGGLRPVDMVIGANWAINCGDYPSDCARMAAITGGRVVHVNPAA